VAGYSTRTLSQKLGIRPNTRIVALGAPPTYRSLLEPMPEGASLHSRLPASAEFIHRFVRSGKELEADVPRLAAALSDEGILWISWPKQTSGVETDLTENLIRELILKRGLVDVKVCAVDEVWSGLKFVRRIEHRSKKP
jgi:hypothetical protein